VFPPAEKAELKGGGIFSGLIPVNSILGNREVRCTHQRRIKNAPWLMA